MEHVILNSEAAAQAGYVDGQRVMSAGQNDMLLYTSDTEGPGVIDFVPPTGSGTTEVDAETLESARALGLGVRGLRLSPADPSLMHMIGLEQLPRLGGVVGLKQMPISIVSHHLVSSAPSASWQSLPLQQQQPLQLSQEQPPDLPGVPYVPGTPRRRGRPLKLLSSGGGISGTNYVISTSTDMSKLDADYVPPSGHSIASSSRSRPRAASSNKYNTRKRNGPQWSKILASEDGEEDDGANDMGYPIYVPLRPRKRARVVKRAANEQPSVQYILPRKKTIRSVALKTAQPLDETRLAEQNLQFDQLHTSELGTEASGLDLEGGGGSELNLPAVDHSVYAATSAEEASGAEAAGTDAEALISAKDNASALDAAAAAAAAASAAEGNVEVLVCDFCLPVREFGTQAEYDAHVKELHQDPLRPFVCGICNGMLRANIASLCISEITVKCITSTVSLRPSTSTSTGKYARKLYLNVHMGKHNDVRPWRCKLCPAAFKYQCSLITHRAVHEGATQMPTVFTLAYTQICSFITITITIRKAMRRHSVRVSALRVHDRVQGAARRAPQVPHGTGDAVPVRRDRRLHVYGRSQAEHGGAHHQTHAGEACALRGLRRQVSLREGTLRSLLSRIDFLIVPFRVFSLHTI